jgi:hypothetical protein
MIQENLPWGWQRVTADARKAQLELYPRPRDGVLARARVSLDELERWRVKGWISFDAAKFETLDEPLLDEILFVRNLAQSGLPEAQIDGLLRELAPPYRYDPSRTAYSFAFGWAQIPALPDDSEVDSFFREHMSAWVFEKAVLGEFALLEELRDTIMVKIAEVRAARRTRDPLGEYNE